MIDPTQLTTNIPVQPISPPPKQTHKFKFILGGLVILILFISGLFWGKYLIYTPIPSIDPTANWKTYKNTRFGFTLKIPNSWYVYDKTWIDDYPSVYIRDEKNSYDPLTIYILKNPDNLTLNDWLEKNKRLNPSLENINTGTIRGLKDRGNIGVMYETGIKFYTETAYFSNNHFVYFFYFSEKINQLFNSELNNQILSTFRFD